ncbi:PREDICTED: NEDD4 family-interacting protein 2-like [Amphimedon queenslandica]|uniref:Uncharacterized protein n=1 Tax=Amphimedon queenslandica TaxID=400682 RepID=I1EVC6_AMPQE|nr:PREDICTED: NEDD4 family-interacting protein 2-like [Amphimedon queenslandica]|eukprot:XP_003390596.1 PREDICTED: NEDD4 family-interacting protein 2-like [Amphimedon queenslandica]
MDEGYEKKPLLSPEEEATGGGGMDLPPAYEPPKKPVVLVTPIPAAAMPLPTYEQSEKFEKDGVLEIPEGPDGTIRFVSQRRVLGESGSTCEFVVFFLVCFFFSWLGYLISCCLATTLAAQSGAAAGLGLSLVFKTIFVEFQPDYLTGAVHSLCSDDAYYYGEDSVTWNSCAKRYYSFLRLFFWILGFMGLFMFARGISVFCQSRPRRNPNEISNA